MKSYVETAGRGLLTLGLAAALAACGGGGGSVPASVSGLPAAVGPAADYPVTIGDPYTIDGVTHEPRDVLNYDEVGYAALDRAGVENVSGEHHTLPLPSYVEVTSLESGRTILVRLERRGPMAGNQLIGLSAAPAEQLGIVEGAPVRVRRVNPPEQERAVLRGGARAPLRMDTPRSLVNVLRRKLPNGEGPLPEEAAPVPVTLPEAVSSAPPEPTQAPSSLEPVDLPASSAAPPIEEAPVAAQEASDEVQEAPAAVQETPVEQPVVPPAPEAEEPPAVTAAAATGAFAVQAGAFSVKENADRVASAIGGTVSRPGRLYLVRTGPFATRQEAEASLAKVRSAGYSDARILNGS